MAGTQNGDELLDHGSAPDLEALMARIRARVGQPDGASPVAVAAEALAAATAPPAAGGAARPASGYPGSADDASVARALQLLGTLVGTAQTDLALLEEWLRVETARNAAEGQKLGARAARLEAALDALGKRVDALASYTAALESRMESALVELRGAPSHFRGGAQASLPGSEMAHAHDGAAPGPPAAVNGHSPADEAMVHQAIAGVRSEIEARMAALEKRMGGAAPADKGAPAGPMAPKA
jgi:hypothetical protein